MTPRCLLRIVLLVSGSLSLGSAALHAQQQVTTLSDPLSDSISNSVYESSPGDAGLLGTIPGADSLAQPTQRTAILDPLFSSITTGTMTPLVFANVGNSAVPTSDVSALPATDPELLKKGIGLRGSVIAGWRGTGAEFSASTPRALGGSTNTRTALSGIPSASEGGLASRAAFAGDTAPPAGGLPGERPAPLSGTYAGAYLPGAGGTVRADAATAGNSANGMQQASSSPFGPDDPYLNPTAAPAPVYPAPYTTEVVAGVGESTFPQAFPELGTVASGSSSASALSSLPTSTSARNPAGARSLERTTPPFGSELRTFLSVQNPGTTVASAAGGAQMGEPAVPSFDQMVREYRRDKLLSGDTTPMPSLSVLRKAYRQRIQQLRRPPTRNVPGMISETPQP